MELCRRDCFRHTVFQSPKVKHLVIPVSQLSLLWDKRIARACPVGYHPFLFLSIHFLLGTLDEAINEWDVFVLDMETNLGVSGKLIGRCRDPRFIPKRQTGTDMSRRSGIVVKFRRSYIAKDAVCWVQLKCDGRRWRTGGKVKGKLANGVGSQYSSHYLGTWCIQHYYRWCAHLGCQSSTELTPPSI